MDLKTKKVFASAILMLFLCSFLCFASSDLLVLQSYSKENYIDLFLSKDLNTNTINAKISGKKAEIISSSSFKNNSKVTIKTTILVDVSTSIPINSRKEIINYLDYKIENIQNKEEIKIVTFGSDLNVLQDFTVDRFDLSKAAKNIKFESQESKIYDAIYNTFPDIENDHSNIPIYYRTIVITDGIDDSPSGITKEELFLKYQTNKYTTSVIEASNTKKLDPQKELLALTRISTGDYANIYPQCNISEISSKIDTSINNSTWIRLKIPDILLDGSTREVVINDGDSEVKFDVKVNSVDSDLEEKTKDNTSYKETKSSKNTQDDSRLNESTEENPDKSTDENADESTDETTEETQDKASSDFQSDLFDFFEDNVLIICVSLASFFVIIIIIIVISKSKNRKKELDSTNNQRIEKNANEDKIKYQDAFLEQTEFVDISKKYLDFTIKISVVGNPDVNWVLELDRDILIGRSEWSTIKIYEKSVSREQCKITVKDNQIMLLNLSHTNKTFLIGRHIEKAEILHSGDVIKFGRVSLIVDYIKSLGKNTKEPGKGDFSGNTESMF